MTKVKKPCPFCGENCSDLVINQGTKWAHYEPSCLEVRTGYNILEDEAPWRQEAIDAWNKRAQTDLLNTALFLKKKNALNQAK